MSGRLRRRLAPLLLILLACPGWAGIPDSRELVFDILRGGDVIGRHRIAFRPDGETLHVDIDITIRVRLLGLTVYRYEHSNRETWRDGRLAAIRTRTDDDGDQFAVDGTASGDGFVVSTGKLERTLPAGILPTSYWRPDTVRQDELLNTQTGELMQVEIAEGDQTAVAARGETIEARHYVMRGDLRLELWYDANDILVRIRFQAADGSTIDYALHPPGASG